MKALIIPSAILVSKEMQKKVGKIPSILCPIKDRTMLDNLVELYAKRVDKIVIVGYKKIDLIKDYIKYKNYNIDVLELDVLRDLGYTVKYGIEYLYEKYSDIEGIYINFADILVTNLFDFGETDTIFFSNDYIGEEWTYFKQNECGELEEIWDKMDVELPYKDGWNLFVGVIYITKANEYVYLLQQTNEQLPKEWDSFYKALYLYSHQHAMTFILTDKWLDVGHAENYFKAKTGVEARVFNTLEIDKERGILKKTSDNKEKLINEIKWYLQLPEKLQYLTPRIYKYSLNIENPYVEMEYYGYNTLHELLIWGDLPLQQWKNYFEKLKFILNDMGKYKYINTKEELSKSIEEIYIKKTINRMSSIRDNENYACLFNEPIYINGVKYHTLSEYMAILPNIVHKFLLDGWTPEFNVIHGDLCFSNILIENNFGFMRIIDPRGKFGEFDVYGDPRYEMAKLMHSIEGKYDFIIEDMFHITQNGSQIQYSIAEKNPEILQVFKEVFKDRIGNYISLQLIEATLFLSMIPLHDDHPNRQLAMLSTGVQLFECVMKETNEHDKNI